MLRISNNGAVNRNLGSIIDIETRFISVNEIEVEIVEIAKQAHIFEKCIFFGLFKEDYLNKIVQKD